jgi:hypothetical protein
MLPTQEYLHSNFSPCFLANSRRIQKGSKISYQHFSLLSAEVDGSNSFTMVEMY